MPRFISEWESIAGSLISIWWIGIVFSIIAILQGRGMLMRLILNRTDNPIVAKLVVIGLVMLGVALMVREFPWLLEYQQDVESR